MKNQGREENGNNSQAVPEVFIGLAAFGQQHGQLAVGHRPGKQKSGKTLPVCLFYKIAGIPELVAVGHRLVKRFLKSLGFHRLVYVL